MSPSMASIGSNPVQYVTGSSTCSAQQTKYISVEAFVPATISSQIPDQCNTSAPINLLPFTLSNLGSWSGNGIYAGSFNPALSGSGNFVLTYKTASKPSGLCPDQSTIAVNVYSLAPPDVTRPAPICNSFPPFQLQVSPVGGVFTGANTPAVDQKGWFVPNSAVIGENIINYSITSGPCVAYVQTTVNVEKFISADLAKYPGPYCRYDNAIDLNSFVQNPGGSWTGPGMAGSMFNPQKAIAGKSNLILYTTAPPLNPTLCPDTTMIRIQVNEVPDISIYSLKTQGCAPFDVTLNTPNVNSGNLEWNFGDGSENKKGSLFFVTHLYTTPGTYTVSLGYRDEIGCLPKSTPMTTIAVFELPAPDFTVPDEIFISAPEVQLMNLTYPLTQNRYNWKIPGALESSTEISPRVEFPKIGKYQITLTAENSDHCKNETTKTIEVKNDFNIYIPNSFSPNFDGLNDEFKPVFSDYGLDTKSYQMEVFDRWGHLLFRTTDPKKGWDGFTAKSSEPLKEEVYVYRIKYKDMDGNSYNKMGHVSLVR